MTAVKRSWRRINVTQINNSTIRNLLHELHSLGQVKFISWWMSNQSVTDNSTLVNCLRYNLRARDKNSHGTKVFLAEPQKHFHNKNHFYQLIGPLFLFWKYFTLFIVQK